MGNLEKYIVEYPGRQAIMINPDLVKKQRVSKKGLETLKELHYKVQGILEAMESSDDPAELKRLSNEWTELQFSLQKTWGFPQNKDFHPWYTLPKCRCPKADNAERCGTPYGVYSGNCPIHGDA